MAKEIKDEKAIDNKEQGNNNPAEKDENKGKEPGKIKTFLSKHAGKIKGGLLVAGGLAAGVLADRAGIRFGGRKKGGDDPGDTE